MNKWIIEQWREGLLERRIELDDRMVTRHQDGTLVVHFPVAETAGGLTITTDDEVRITQR